MSDQANIILQAGHPAVQLDNPLDLQQKQLTIAQGETTLKKSRFGLNMDQSNALARDMLQASLDPNATPDSIQAAIDRAGSRYGLQPGITQSWKNQVAQAKDMSEIKDLAMRGSMMALSPVEQFDRSNPTVKLVDTGNGFQPTQFNPPVGPNANQIAPVGNLIGKGTAPFTYGNGQGMVVQPGLAAGQGGVVGPTGLMPATQLGQDAGWTDEQGRQHQGNVQQRNNAVGTPELTGPNPYGTAPGVAAPAGGGSNPYSTRYPVPGQKPGGAGGLQSAPATNPPPAPATSSPSPAPASTDGITVDPLVQEGYKKDSTAYQNVRENANNTRDGINSLVNAHDALQLAGIVGNGSSYPAEVLGRVNTLLNTFGMKSDNIDLKVAARDLAKKYLADYARKSMGSLNTNAGLDASNHSNANVDISSTASLDVIKANIGKERMNQYIGDQYPDKTGRGFLDYQKNQGRSFDYRAFSLDMYSPAELQQLRDSLKTKDEKEKFYRSVAAATKSGMLTLGRGNQYGTAVATPPPVAAPPPPASTNPLTGQGTL